MGFQDSGSKNYLTITDGKIIQRVSEGTQGAVKRATKTGKIVWELKHGGYTGYLVGISTKVTVFEGIPKKDWILDFQDPDNGENYQLQVMFDSRYGTTMINALCNPKVDFSRPITVNPWYKVVDGKKRSAIYIKQGEENIDWYFTKDDSKGMPQMVKVRYKGEDVWDNTDMMQFLENYVNQYVKKAIGQAPEYTPPGDVTPKDQFMQPQQGGGFKPNYNLAPDEDDLPF
jgi:hypothetical protein